MRAVEVFMLERGILPRQVAALVSAGELFPGANDVQSAIGNLRVGKGFSVFPCWVKQRRSLLKKKKKLRYARQSQKTRD